MGKTSLRPQQRSAQNVQMPAPFRGINTLDPLQSMDPSYGLSIQNFVATNQGLAVRPGYRKWATGLPGTVTSLLAYHGRFNGASRLFACSGSGIYDVTSGGFVGAPVVSGLSATNNYWQSVVQTYTQASASILIAVNGADAPRLYDGSVWQTCTQVASPAGVGQFAAADANSNPVSISNFVDVVLHQQRLWFVANNTTVGYYCDIGQVGGALHPLDFGPFFPNGGKLQKLATWTMDSGGSSGTQAMLVGVSDKGDVVVFQGTNPSSATDWSMIGQYKIGSPVGRRCTTQYEGDLLILTQDGLNPMSKYLQSERVESSSALTYKISPTISNLVASLSNTPGFEASVYPGANIMLLNIPQSLQSNNFQFCFNTITQGWTQFTGWPAQCYGLFNDAFYFGGTGFVALAFIGYQDGADINGAGGNNIIATAMTAFSSMDAAFGSGVVKHVKQVKPFLVTGSSSPNVFVGVNTDFNLTPIIGSATVNPATGAVWDTARWDDPSTTWVGSLTTVNRWTGVASYPGTYAAVTVSVSATADTLWSATDLLVAPGGPFA
jgi:hypothetical protein